MKYATLRDTGWATEFVESEDVGAPDLYTSIAIKPDGYPCISYHSIHGEYLKFAYADDKGWHSEEITELPDTYLTRLRFLSDGRPIIGFIGESDDQTAAIFKFALGEPDYKTWHFQQRNVSLFFLPNYRWTDFVLDSQDHYHLVYLGTDFHLYYDYFDGNTWSAADLYDFYPSTATIAIDNNDVPHIVIASSDLYYYSPVGDQWQEELVDDHIKPDYSSSLVFDSFNNPHIAIQGTPHASTKGQSMMYYSYITGNPQILLPVPSHDYGDVFTGSFLDWECPIKNVGNAPLTISELGMSTSYFETPSATMPFTIPPGDSAAVTIRFSPAAAQACQADLAIHSNDSATPVATVSLTGHGVSTGNAGDLSVEVTDVFFEDAYGTLNHEIPLDGAEVSLYQGQNIIAGPVETDKNGQAAFSAVPTGEYTLKISDQITLQDGVTGKTLNKHRDITIGPGANSYSMAVPESLVVQTYASVHALTHLETNKFSIPYTFTFEKSEAGVLNTLDTWNEDLDDEVELYISRLLLTESMVNELFNDGFSIGIEATHDLGDLISFIFFSDEWVKKLIKILIDLIKAMEPGGSQSMLNDLLQMLFEEALKYAVLQMVTDGVEMAAAEVPSPGEEMINAIWRDVREEYCGFPDLSLNPTNWNHVKSLVYDMIKVTFFQEVYVDQLTGPAIEKAENYASQRQINGSLITAFEKKISFISNRKNAIETTGDVAYALRTSANLLMLTTATLDWVATLDPTGVAGEIASRASFYMKGAAYMNVASALGMSVYQFFITPKKIDHTVDRIFFPGGEPEALARSLPSGSFNVKHPLTRGNTAVAKMSTSMHRLLANKLESSAAAYDSLLNEIQNGIEAGAHLQSVAKLKQLVEADHRLQQSMRESRTPIQ
ncbi:MAG: SpaA isopeptide-forming pilin-related protein, partial [Calditrichota bacterium]